MKAALLQLALDTMNILLPLLASGLAAGIAYLGKLSADWIKAHVKAKWLQSAMLRLDDVVFSVVKEVQQTIVDGMQEAAKDGKITPEEAKAVKERAIAIVKGHLGIDGLKDLLKILGLDSDALDSLISTKIEAAVHDMKVAVPVNPTIA